MNFFRTTDTTDTTDTTTWKPGLIEVSTTIEFPQVKCSMSFLSRSQR